MRSIQTRLSLGLAVALAFLLLVGGVLLYRQVRRTLIGAFDQALQERAGALASRLKLEIDPKLRPLVVQAGAEAFAGLDTGDESRAAARRALVALAGRAFRVAFVHDPRLFPAYERADDAEVFEVWGDDGAVLFRSKSLAGGDLPLPSDAGTSAMTLPDGRRGRLAVVKVSSVPFEDPKWQPVWERVRALEDAGTASATVVAGRSVEDLLAFLATLRRALLLSGLLLALGGGALAAFVVRRGLQPLRSLGRQIRGLHVEALDERIHLAAPPAELEDVVSSLNRALASLEEAFERERRTTANIAHELRTPIAELRSLMEVAAQWPEDPALGRRAVEEGQLIAVEMSGVIAALLDVARRTSSAPPAARVAIDVRALVEGAWAGLEPEAVRRRQHLGLDGPAAARLHAERASVEALMRNLLENAIHHAPEGSEVRVAITPRDGHIDIEIENPASGDGSTDPGGLGLALAATWAARAGLEISSCREDGRFVVRLVGDASAV